MVVPLRLCETLIVVGLIIIALKLDKKFTIWLKDVPYVERFSGYLGTTLFTIGLLIYISGSCA